MNSVIEKILNKGDMCLPRTPHDLSEWVLCKSDEMSATHEARLYARSGKMLPKKFWEEIRPLSLFASLVYGKRKDILFTPNIGNEDFDALAQDTSANTHFYIEISYAKDGYDESLRLEVLNESGTVNALGDIDVSGTKASGARFISVANEAVRHDIIRDEALSLVEQRITNKCDGRYGEQHVLIIVLDDYLPFRTERDKGILESSVADLIGSLTPTFKSIYLLGSSGSYLKNVFGAGS